MLLGNSDIKEGPASAKKVVNYRAELAYGDTRYPGFVGNLSKNSLYMITFPVSTPLTLTRGTTLQVRLDPPSKESICLHCKVMWAYKTPPHGLTHSIGMQIIDSFPNFQDLMDDLFR
jgi:hypothetical protein